MGVRLLRHRPGRLRAQPQRRRDRRAGRAAPRAPRADAALGNVVFMGMGEPLANYDRTWARGRRLHDDLGISARHLTVSTVGIVPGIRRLAGEDLPVNLAVSLHAANDALRDELVPINRRYPLDALMAACARLPRGQGPPALVRVGAHRRRERPRQPTPRELADIARPLQRPREPHPAQPDAGATTRRARRPARVRAFRDLLHDARRQRHRPPEPRHRRSTPRAASCAPPPSTLVVSAASASPARRRVAAAASRRRRRGLRPPVARRTRCSPPANAVYAGRTDLDAARARRARARRRDPRRGRLPAPVRHAHAPTPSSTRSRSRATPTAGSGSRSSPVHADEPPASDLVEAHDRRPRAALRPHRRRRHAVGAPRRDVGADRHVPRRLGRVAASRCAAAA